MQGWRATMEDAVIPVDVTEERLGSVVEKAPRLGSPDVITVRADVSITQDCSQFIDDAAVHHFGGCIMYVPVTLRNSLWFDDYVVYATVDHLVNNAGIALGGLFKNADRISDCTPVMVVCPEVVDHCNWLPLGRATTSTTYANGKIKL
ncbi:hypothetical protein Pint_01217 [Pistacia integerrima]|uniref:Uncharacterized protein n=1 Tax=Pistacia integerrima TaxID=434235 RepID=A0ACC0ZGQ3_9ROSI|nr:hypothetical protein Pint_01217 [Pistacia integerrima]